MDGRKIWREKQEDFVGNSRTFVAKIVTFRGKNRTQTNQGAKDSFLILSSSKIDLIIKYFIFEMKYEVQIW